MDQTIIVMLVSLAVLLIMCVPICAALGLSVIAAILFSPEGIPLEFYTQKFLNTFDSFPIMAVPFFVLSGDIMTHGTLAEKLINMCKKLLGHVSGGLAQVSIITCLFYGALCGSAVATTAAVGGATIPAMKADEYPPVFASATNAAAGCLGMMIPPSVPLILYGSLTDVSITDLFIAAIVPGFLWCGGLLITAWFICRTRGYGKVAPRAKWSERLAAIWQARWALGVPVFVLGGIYSGMATPTEAGVLAVLYSLVVELFITRSLKFRDLRRVFMSSINTIGMVMFVCVAAMGMGTLLTWYNLHEVLLQATQEFSSNPYVIMGFVLLLLLFLGTFLESGMIILILSAVLMPLMASYGWDPVQFGVVMAVMAGLGLLTPPVGLNLFVACGIGDVTIREISIGIIPYLVVSAIAALLIAYVPWFSLCLV